VQVAAFVKFTRYIVLTTDGPTPTFPSSVVAIDPDKIKESLNRTKTHELVHAAIKCSIGLRRSQQVPTWLDEGLAILYSDSWVPFSWKETTQTGNAIIHTVYQPREYQRYQAEVGLLRYKLGRDFASKVKSALVGATFLDS
jgi:hypothetical protein